MNRAEDHVLEHALGALLGAPPTDLPTKVLRSLRQGTERADSRATPPRPAARLVWILSAVAALLVVAWWFDGRLRRTDPTSSTFVATSAVELGVFRAGERIQRRQTSFRSGETLVNGPEREQRVSLSTGSTITMGRCAMLTLARDEEGLVVVPHLGRATLEVADRSALRVRTDLGTLVVQGPSAARVELLVAGYGLEHPERFQQLAEEIHMNSALPMVMTVATLVAGTAVIETTTGTRSLRLGESIVHQEVDVSVELIKEKLLEEVGTWDLTVTNIDRDGHPAEPLKGVEVCRAGPGGEWLLSELSVRQGEREIATHTVIGYDSRNEAYTGSLIDSFGGEMGLLRGTAQKDLGSRTLQMFSARSTPGFDARSHMRWESPSRRVTEIEVLRDEEWVLIREIIHQRRK